MAGVAKDTIQVVAVGLIAALLMVGVASPYTIDGDSMVPALSSGDVVLVNKIVYQWQEPQPQEMVIVATPYGLMAKRVVREISPDKYWVEGDNKDFSTDSRVYGPVDRSKVIGKIGMKLWRK